MSPLQIGKSKIRNIMTNTDNALKPETLLDSGSNRLTLHATLAPTGNRDRIQPAGFPDIGHVIYDSPQSDGTVKKVCIVDSAASMANHLETVCHEGSFGAVLHRDLSGLPYVQCVTDGGNNGKNRLVVTSLSEGHRLASSLFTDKRSTVVSPSEICKKNLGEILRNEEFKLGSLPNPLPSDWWNVFQTIFQFDPNSLIHGILFPSMGIKISRVLTAQLDAINADRVAYSGVKFDKLLMTTSGQPIFAKDEETAAEIRATFVIDLALIRSFGQGLGQDSKGLTEKQKTFLVAFVLWKIARLLGQPFRYRSGCDLEFKALYINGNREELVPLPEIEIRDYMDDNVFLKNLEDRVTKVYWPENEIFKKVKNTSKTADDNRENDGEEL